MIALLVPSRGRPEQLKRMIESVKATADSDVKIYVTVSPEEYNGYTEVLKGYGAIICQMPENLPTCQKWNILAEVALKTRENKLFMLAADDMVFSTPLWDTELINRYNTLQNKVHIFALQDSRDKDGTPHPIMTREYIEHMGWFVPPIFLHWNIDSWTVAAAKAANCFTHLRDYELLHIKPSDKGAGDETHNRIRNWGWRERDKYVADKMGFVLEAMKFRLQQATGYGRAA